MKWLWAWLMSLLTVTNPVASPAPAAATVLQEQGGFLYSQVSVADVSRLRLFSNLADQKSATELAAAKNCEVLVNAGFYDTNNRHLGWFLSGGEELSPRQANRLFDGFLSVASGRAEIGFNPGEAADFGLQSGPVLVFDSKPFQLSIKDDQPRRRVAAALTRDNQLMFLVILSPQSDYSGPLLADTPKIIAAINPQIVSAINLDGGSASAFITPKVNLPEYQPLGGFFCYTKL